jgi:hypothetical protein
MNASMGVVFAQQMRLLLEKINHRVISREDQESIVESINATPPSKRYTSSAMNLIILSIR